MVNAKMACLMSMAMLLAGSGGIGCKTRNELNARWVDSPDPKNISFYIDHSDTKYIEVSNGTGKEVEYTVKIEAEPSVIVCDPSIIVVKPNAVARIAVMGSGQGKIYETGAITIDGSDGSLARLAYECYAKIETSVNIVDNNGSASIGTNLVFTRKPEILTYSLKLEFSVNAEDIALLGKTFVLESDNPGVVFEKIDGKPVNSRTYKFRADWYSTTFSVRLGLQQLETFPAKFSIIFKPEWRELGLDKPYPFNTLEPLSITINWLKESNDATKAIAWTAKIVNGKREVAYPHSISQTNPSYVITPVNLAYECQQYLVYCHEISTGKKIFETELIQEMPKGRLFHDYDDNLVSNAWFLTPKELYRLEIPAKTLLIMPYGEDALVIGSDGSFKVYDGELKTEIRSGAFTGFSKHYIEGKIFAWKGTQIVGDTIVTLHYEPVGNAVRNTVLSFDLSTGKMQKESFLALLSGQSYNELLINHARHEHIEHFETKSYEDNIIIYQAEFDGLCGPDMAGFHIYDFIQGRSVLSKPYDLDKPYYFNIAGNIAIVHENSAILAFDLASGKLIVKATCNDSHKNYEKFANMARLYDAQGKGLLVVNDNVGRNLTAYDASSGKVLWSMETTFDAILHDSVIETYNHSSGQTETADKNSGFIDPASGKTIPGMAGVLTEAFPDGSFLITTDDKAMGETKLAHYGEDLERIWSKTFKGQCQDVWVDNQQKTVCILKDGKIWFISRFTGSQELVLEDDPNGVNRRYPTLENRFVLCARIDGLYEYEAETIYSYCIFNCIEKRIAWDSSPKASFAFPDTFGSVQIIGDYVVIYNQGQIACLSYPELKRQLER